MKCNAKFALQDQHCHNVHKSIFQVSALPPKFWMLFAEMSKCNLLKNLFLMCNSTLNSWCISWSVIIFYRRKVSLPSFFWNTILTFLNYMYLLFDRTKIMLYNEDMPLVPLKDRCGVTDIGKTIQVHISMQVGLL